MFRLMEASARRRAVATSRLSATAAGRVGARAPISSSPLQPCRPRVAGLGDPDLEAVDTGLALAARRDPDNEGVYHAPVAGGGRIRRHPGDGVLGDPKPDMVAVRIEFGTEPEGPVGLVRDQGPSGRRPSPRDRLGLTIASALPFTAVNCGR